MVKICKLCNSEFKARHSIQIYCSKHCSSRGKAKSSPITISCAVCNKSFERYLSDLKNSKSGIYFCSRACKGKAQRIGTQIPEILPPHYGKSTAYRALAMRNKEKICERCGYQDIPEILEVHHRDQNRSNNELSNLEILCPTCHAEVHYKFRNGPRSEN